MKRFLTLTCMSALTGLAAASCAEQKEVQEQEIGATLNDKADVSIEDVPPAVLEAAHAMRPDITFTEAEREIRNGVVYYDVGGVDANGNEIELDIMQDGEGWRVVEIQRDIVLEEAPEAVVAAFRENAPGVEPARIIESDQTDGVIIYEFFAVSDNGDEKKYEVKYDGESAEFLTEEWVH